MIRVEIGGGRTGERRTRKSEVRMVSIQVNRCGEAVKNESYDRSVLVGARGVRWV